MIRSIPACLAREGQDAREIFTDQDCLDRLMQKSAGGSATQRLKLREADGRMAFATVKAVKELVSYTHLDVYKRQVIAFLTGLLALIGLSNVWASISGNLRQRSREFAMLKSVGLSPLKLRRMLLLEGLNLGLKPLLYSLPFQAAVLAGFLYLNEVSLGEYLPYAPYAAVLGYTCLLYTSTAQAAPGSIL